jgi:hypothetical protein
VSIGGVALAQSGVPQLGLTEQDARRYVEGLFSYSVRTWDEDASSTWLASSFGHTLREAAAAYAKLPAAARGPATSALYAWARTYTGSSAFRTAYEERRQARKPEPPTYERTVEQEVKAKVAEREEGFQALLKLGQSKAQVDALRKQAEQFGGEAFLRQEIEAQRAAKQADYDTSMKAWETDVPADPTLAIAGVLRRFLGTTGDVDFAAKGRTVKERIGLVVDFENDAHDKRPWQWQFAWMIGPEVTGAARAAAAEWLKAMGR